MRLDINNLLFSPLGLRVSGMALLASTVLGGCGYSQVPMNYTNYDTVEGPRMARQEVMPTLPRGVEPRSISVDPAQATGRVGESIRFNVSVKGSDGKIYSDARLATWTISNPQLGTIDRNGLMTPQSPGTLKVVAAIGALTAEASLQVEQARYAWQQVLSPTGVDLRAVKMVTRNEAWAGGDKGTMLRFINGAWHKEPNFRQGDANVRGLGFANTALGWAVGNRAGGTVPWVARWDGNAWINEKLPAIEGTLNAISVLGERDAWAVGQESGGDALILHYDGFNWKQMEAPAKGKLNDVQMLSPKRGWAVGSYGGAGIPLIFKYENGTWRKSGMWDNRGAISLTNTLELKAIKMVSETQGYAVGSRDGLLINLRGLFLQYEPKRDGWVPGQWDAAVADLDQVPLYDVEMISGTEGWALGEIRRPDYSVERNPKSIFGNLLANQGGVLKMDTNYFSGNLSGAFYAIDLLPQGEGFVVGANGYVLQRTYDWRGLNTSGLGTTGGYGSSTPGNNAPITYGPGGQQVPGGQQPARNY